MKSITIPQFQPMDAPPLPVPCAKCAALYLHTADCPTGKDKVTTADACAS